MSHEIHNYAELKRQIQKDLRTQHPEWIQPDGKCPECDEHEARLNETLEAVAQSESITDAAPQTPVEDETARSTT